MKGHVVHGAPREYDVYNRNGHRIRTVVMRDDSRVVGFGNGAVYVACTDEDDLQWLERFARSSGDEFPSAFRSDSRLD